MSLITFIDRILTENNMLQYPVEDVEEYVFEKAKEEANGESSIGIDDETVKKWILDYTPDKKVEFKTKKTKAGYEVYDNGNAVKVDKKEDAPKQPRNKIVSTKDKDKVEGSWGVQESLF